MTYTLISLTLLILPAQLLAANCNPGDQFWISKSKIFYGKTELSGEKSPIILKPTKECKKLFPFCNHTPVFAKNKKKVFFKDQEVKNADPASFEYVCDDFGKDRNRVFRATKSFSKQDSKAFVLDGSLGIYKTSKRVFNREGKEIPGADPKTLEKVMFEKKQLLDFIKDKNSVYHLWGVKLKVKAKDLRTYGLEYLGDKRSVYFRTRPIKGADPETFKVNDPELHLSEDKNNFYVEEKIKKQKITADNVKPTE